MADMRPAADRARYVLHKMASTLGLHVGRFPSRDTLQGHLVELFKRTRINCVLDVGAHLGEFADEIREIGYKGRVVSFEPVRASYEAIAAKAAGRRDWQVYNCALGTEEGTREINVYQGTVFNSFLSSAAYAEERFGEVTRRERTEQVSIRRLDSLFGEAVAGLEDPRVFLKMDTQGWDLQVLDGASGVLDKITALQSELAVKQCYDGMVSYTDALVRYAAKGFEVTGIFPVARDADGLRVVEFDCVLLRVT